MLTLYNNNRTTINMDNQNNQINQSNPQHTNAHKEQPIEDDGQSSSWSLESLEDIKHLSLRDLQAEQEPREHQHKTKEPLQVKFPEKPTVLSNAPLHQVGKVIYVVGQLLILQSQHTAPVVDLQNWLCDQQRNLIGFVIDVLGKVQNPFYALRLETITNITDFLGKTIYYLQGSSKILRDEDIKSMRSKSAIDAIQQEQSSSSDEENLRIQRDFSEEIQQKREVFHHERRNKFRPREAREQIRDRTRQGDRNNRNASRSRNQHNQRYLESVYSSHYNQMMRMYNNNFQPNHPNNAMQNPYGNPQIVMNMPMPMHGNQVPNIAQFGSSNNTHLFYGQSFPTNNGPNQVSQNGQPSVFNYNAQGPPNANFFVNPNNNMFNSPK